MKIINVLIFGFLFSILAGCGDGTSDIEYETKTLFINSQLVDCVGEGIQKCMQVKENEDDEWELFYDEIAGFSFEEGYLYEILVEVVDVEDPPADASSVEYILIEIVYREAV